MSNTMTDRGAAFGTILEVNGGLELHAPTTATVRKSRVAADGCATEVYVDGVLYIHADHVRSDMLALAPAAMSGTPSKRSGTIRHLYEMAIRLARDIDAGRYNNRDLGELDTADALLTDALNLIGHDGPATASETGAAYYADMADE